MSRTLQPAVKSCDTGQRIHFLTAVDQLTITWNFIRMATIKLNTDCICLGHLASNAWSIQENNARLAANRSARTIVAIYTVIILMIQLPEVNCSFIFFVYWYF